MTRTMTLSDFEQLADNGEWKHAQEVERCDSTHYDENELDEGQEAFVKVIGQGRVISVCGDVKITYTEGFDYHLGNEDTFSPGTEAMSDSEIWSIEGVIIVDEDGDEVTKGAIADCLSPAFSTVDYDGFDCTKEED